MDEYARLHSQIAQYEDHSRFDNITHFLPRLKGKKGSKDVQALFSDHGGATEPDLIRIPLMPPVIEAKNQRVQEC